MHSSSLAPASAQVGAGVLAGCRQRLLLERRAELEALRRGFTLGGAIDLALQLAPIPCEQLMMMVRARAPRRAAASPPVALSSR